jgi:hypothetical protein
VCVCVTAEGILWPSLPEKDETAAVVAALSGSGRRRQWLAAGGHGCARAAGQGSQMCASVKVADERVVIDSR